MLTGCEVCFERRAVVVVTMVVGNEPKRVEMCKLCATEHGVKL